MSWQDHIMAHNLTKENVLDYFSQRSNRFYDITCNNETIKMQNRSLQHLQDMKGVEYVLYHHQEPILFVIRKQKRLSPRQVQTIADYYVVAGTVYQAPDLGSIINSRLMTTLHHLDNAFKETHANARYHPAKGYSWQFNDDKEQEEKKKKNKTGSKKQEEKPASAFQYGRVDNLLGSLVNKFPFLYAKSESSEQRPVPIANNKQQRSGDKAPGDGDKEKTKTPAASAAPVSNVQPATVLNNDKK